MSGIRVTAPYVTMKIKQNVGGVVITGFYKDAVVQAADVDPEDRERLLAKGMIEEVPEPKPEPAKAKEPEKEPDSAKEPPKEPQKAAAKEPEAPSKAAKSSGGGS
jgi:hypothetical protein